jgi:glucosamine--fructose-6-phosphate aminotransferase (isomerizing)
MCGIVGILSRTQSVVPRLIEGLKRLEYRGYDSAGVATIHNGCLERRRQPGKLVNLEHYVQENPLEGFIGIGHTRWATHGLANISNAHPHGEHKIAVVHNGIIENFSILKKKLQGKGYQFESDTDTEVVVHILADYIQEGFLPFDAFKQMTKDIQGAFALAVIFEDFPNQLLIARSGSPLVIGYGQNDVYVGSDALALAPWTDTISYLEENDIACIVLNNNQQFDVKIFDSNHEETYRAVHKTSIHLDAISKGNFNHYMLKEIHEQPKSMSDTLQSLVDIDTLKPREILQKIPLKKAKKVAFIACGTSYHGCKVAKYWFESLAKISVDIDIASEFRYRKPILNQYDLVVFVSQSGETIDTLSALKMVKAAGIPVLSMVNVEGSSIDRASDFSLLTQAGPEIGVASTKAFTAQLLVFSVLASWAAFEKGEISKDEWAKTIKGFIETPSHILETLSLVDDIQQIAHRFVDCRDVLYFGRGTNFPLALEGALKLKELSYIHAEAYPAGELKHGAIALIDQKLPVVVVAPYDEWFHKTLSNVQEVIARGAHVVAITDREGIKHFRSQIHKNIDYLVMKSESDFLRDPILYAIPLQLLAYYTAYFKGTDVDQPRNLAKSVTVE